jgi:hypothetical protein
MEALSTHQFTVSSKLYNTPRASPSAKQIEGELSIIYDASYEKKGDDPSREFLIK